MNGFEQFVEQFNFDPQKNLMVGMERECFLLDHGREISPIAPKVVAYFKGGPGREIGYELSACQLECRIGPCLISELKDKLLRSDAKIKKAEKKVGFKRSFVEVAPNDMSLEVYPDPTGRYQEIVKQLPREILLAACQIIATHIHIGMPSHSIALRVYNAVINHVDELCRLGDHSSGKRLSIYKKMAPKNTPIAYNAWEDYYNLSVEDGFTDDPRSCWHLIRLSVNGTIEFRMFGATTDFDELVLWATRCHALCQNAL